MAEPCPTDGISLWALREFVAQHKQRIAAGRMSSGDVGLQIIKPATKAEACSYVEKLRAQAPRNTSPVGRATLFLSHAWRSPFLDLFAAIDSHLTATYGAARAGEQYIWRVNIEPGRMFDLFTLCQHDKNCRTADPRCDCGSRRTPLSQAQGWLSTSLKTAIHSIKRVLAVLDPWDDPVPLKRCWCLWEYMCALEGAKSDVRLEVVLSPTQERAFHEALSRNFDTILNTLSAVDCLKATAYDKRDEQMIFAAIESTSFKAGGLNEAVTGRLRQWLEESSLRVLQNTAGPEKLKLQMKVAGFLHEQGKEEEADRLYKQLLADQIATLGRSHPDTLATRHNYSINLEAQGRFEEAMEQLIESSQLQRSGGYTDIASANNLASLYLKMDQPNEAVAVASKAVEHSLRTRGKEDPVTLSLSMNLGLAYYKLGRLRDAMTLMSQTLAAKRRILGNRHGDTLGAMSSLADVYDEMGEVQKAAALHREVLQIYTETLGKSHPKTLGAMGKIGLSLQDQGRLDEAEAYLTKLAGQYEKVMGGQHIDTLMCLSNLATVKRDQGKLRESEDLCTRVLAARRRMLGDDHAETLDSIHNLGNLRYQMGRLGDAEVLYTEELKRRRRKSSSKTHSDTYKAAYSLAGVYANTGRVLEAERLCTEAYSGLCGNLGESHDLTQAAASLLMQLQQARKGGLGGAGRSSGRYY